MESHVITSVHNPRIRQWMQLLERKGRNKQQKYLLEGVHLVEEAFRWKAPVETVLYSMEKGVPASLTSFKEAAQDGETACEWIAVSDAVLKKCSETETPQGVIAIVRQQPYFVTAASTVSNAAAVSAAQADSDTSAASAVPVDWSTPVDSAALAISVDSPFPAASIPAAIAKRFSGPEALVVVLDGIQDPGNLGTIIRSADAVGASGVILGRGTVDLYNPKTLRATMGSLFHLPVVWADLPELLAQLPADGPVQVISTSLRAEDSCYDVDFTRPTWMIFGNEGAGVSPQVESFVGRRVRIPMPGRAESLNVAMAATVMLFEAARQRGFSPNKNSCP